MAALEQPKKPAGGAFGRFLAEKRAEFTKRCAGQPVSAVTKLGGEEWKKLDDAQKEPYQKLFKKAQAKYDEDMKAYLAAGGEKKKGAAALRAEKRKAKEGKKTKDPNRPKKPTGGAYGVFLANNRVAFQKECPGSVTGVTKLASTKWKALSDADKVPFEKEYQEKMAAYQEAMKSYTPPADAGEDEEEDEADEDDAKEQSPAKKAKKADNNQKATPVKASGGKGRGRGAKKAPENATPEVELPKTVQEKADAKGYTDVLKKLLGRDDIQEKGVSASKALEALDSSNGLLHGARRALLGA